MWHVGREEPKIPDTPGALRGQAYTTHLYARCPEFKACRRCFMCQNFNIHNPLCQLCEGTKPGMRHHTCSVDQVDAILQLEEKINRPMFDINADPSKIKSQVMSSCDSENARLIERLAVEEWK